MDTHRSAGARSGLSAAVLLAALLAAASLAACGDDSGSPSAPTRTTLSPMMTHGSSSVPVAHSLPADIVVASGQFRLDPSATQTARTGRFIAVPFRTDWDGTLHVNAEWTPSSHGLDMSLYRGACSGRSIEASCQLGEQIAEAHGAHMSVANLRGDDYTLIIRHAEADACAGAYRLNLTR